MEEDANVHWFRKVDASHESQPLIQGKSLWRGCWDQDAMGEPELGKEHPHQKWFDNIAPIYQTVENELNGTYTVW